MIVIKLGNYLRFAGGEVAAKLSDKDVTHVVVVGCDQRAEREVAVNVRHIISWRRKVPRVVTPSWVVESWNEKTMLDEERYTPA